MKIKLIDYKGTSKKSDDVSIIIPVNPEKIVYKAAGKFQQYDIINKGSVKIPSGKDLAYISWESFFPGDMLKDEPYVHGYKKAKNFHSKLESWCANGTKLKLTITETPISVYVYVENYEASWEGPNGNIYYSVEFSVAVDVSVESVKKKKGKTSGTARTSKYSGAKKYTVKKGDSLWTISKRFYKDPKQWKKIYKANKSTIEKAAKNRKRKSSNNGHLIYPGTILNIP